MANGRIEVITSVARRRRFSRAEKERVVSALMEPGANASEVARGAGVDRGQLYRWRRELSELAAPAASPAFMPVAIVPEATELARETPTLPSPATIAISFGSCIHVKVEGAPDAGTLARVIDALSTRAGRR